MATAGFNRGERGWYLHRRGWLQRTDGLWHNLPFAGSPGQAISEEEAERAQLDSDAAVLRYVMDARDVILLTVNHTTVNQPAVGSAAQLRAELIDEAAKYAKDHPLCGHCGLPIHPDERRVGGMGPAHNLLEYCVGHLRRRYEEMLNKQPRLETCLHKLRAHPDFDYETTEFARKQTPHDHFDQRAKDGWVINPFHNGGFERFEFHEERYWMRPKVVA